MAANTSETITVMATIIFSGDFLNVSTAQANETDPDPNNNTDDGSDGNNGGIAGIVIVPTTGTMALLMLLLLVFAMSWQFRHKVAAY